MLILNFCAKNTIVAWYFANLVAHQKTDVFSFTDSKSTKLHNSRLFFQY